MYMHTPMEFLTPHVYAVPCPPIDMSKILADVSATPPGLGVGSFLKSQRILIRVPLSIFWKIQMAEY